MASRVEVIGATWTSLSSFSFARARTAVAAYAAGELDQRLVGMIDVGDAAVLGDLEANGRLFLPHVIEHRGIGIDDLDGGIELLDLQVDRNRLHRSVGEVL